MLQLKYLQTDEKDGDLIPFPSAEPPTAASAPTMAEANKAIHVAEQKAKLRTELTEMLSAHAPHKLGDVDKMAEAFYDEPERILGVMKERFVKKGDGDQQQQQPSSPYSPSAAAGSPASTSREADIKRICYLRLETLFRNYCPQKMHEVGSVLDAWQDAAGFPTSMFRGLYSELHVPAEEQTFHVGLEAAMAGNVDASSLLSKRGVRRNTIFGAAGNEKYASQQQQLPPDADGVGLAAPGSPGTMTAKGKLLMRFVAARNLLHRDVDGSMRRPDDPNAGMKSASSIWCSVLYPQGRDVFRSPKMTCDVEGNGEWAEDKTNVCALLVMPGESPLLAVQLYNDAGFFLGELRLNLLRLPHKSQHAFALRARVDEHDAIITNAAPRNNGTGLGEIEIKWSYSVDRTATATGAGIGSGLGVATTTAADGSPKSIDDQHQQLSGVKAAMNPIRPRIRAFFARYIPEHLHEVTSVLEEYRGRESELLDALSVRFGPEPDPMAFQTRIERIFCEYDPGRVPEARQIAQKSVGKEEFVVRTLVKKYGPEPSPNYSLPPLGGTASHPPSDPSRIRLTRWLMLRLPRRVSEIEYLLNRFERRENVLFRLLAQTTGPEPTDDPPKSSLRSSKIPTPALREYFAKRQAPLFLRWMWTGETQDGGKSDRGITPFHSKFDQYKARLEAFYSHYNPIKMQEVEETLRRWRGREDILFEALVHKYGAEPTAIHGSSAQHKSQQQQQQQQQQRASAMLMSDPRRPLGATPRAALQSFYAVHNPSKLPDVDRLIERFAGREQSLFTMLEGKYGTKLDPRASSPGGGAGAGGGRAGSPGSGGGEDVLGQSPTRERVIRRPPGIQMSPGGGGGGAASQSRGVSMMSGAAAAAGGYYDADESHMGYNIPNMNQFGGRRPAAAAGGGGADVDFRATSFADHSEL